MEPERQPSFRVRGDDRHLDPQGRLTGTTGDPLIGERVTTPGTPFAKLVDLDVDVQLASRIYGLQVQVADGAGDSVRGTMATANFRDFSSTPGSWASTNRRSAPCSGR